MIQNSVTGSTSTSSITQLNNDERSSNIQGQFNHWSISGATQALESGLGLMGSALKQLPNPLYYLTQSPGKVLAAILLSNRTVADANPLPDNSSILQSESASPIGKWNHGILNSTNFSIEPSGELPAHLLEIEEDGGESAHQDLINSIKTEHDQRNDDSLESADRNRRSTKVKDEKWTHVPLVEDDYRPLRNRELTLDGEFARVGINEPSRLKQKSLQPSGNTVYRFELRDFRDNTLKKTAFSNCPSVREDQLGCKGRVELTNCFFKRGEAPDYSSRKLEFLKESKAYLNDCPKSVPLGDVFSVSMELMVDTLGESIIFQIHGKPDRWLYRSEHGSETYLLSPDSSAKAYKALVDDNMKFEQGGYPPISLSINKHGENYYLALMARSEYVPYNDKGNRCNLRFEKSIDKTNQAKCCDGERDVSYLFNTKIGKNETDLNLLDDWASLKFEIKTSNYSGSEATPGYVKLWINKKMKVNTITYVGRNDASNRGGGNLYGKIGLYRTSSTQPITVKFKSVKMQLGPLERKPRHEIQPTSVTGHCSPILKPYCEP